MLLTATCLFGLEKLVGEEIDALGYKRVETIDGRVTFEAPPEAVAVCNLNFRFAERLYINMGSFYANTFEQLFQGVKNIPWEQYIGEYDAFPVKGHSIKSKLFSIPDCQKIIKKAVVTRFEGVYGRKQFPETGVTYKIEFFILNDKASLMIDTSGEGLHKRGYRTEANLAPIRETLAAAMVSLSRPRDEVILVDPCCGSGTIPIEAALMDMNMAPGINRSFAAEEFPAFPKTMWEDAKAQARLRQRAPVRKIFGFDIDPESLKIARNNARRAGTEHIVFEERDVRNFVSPIEEARGTIVCNPPYGERLMDKESAFKLYEDMGKAFSKNVPNWQLYIISSDENFQKHFGRRADKARKMYNGMIKCELFQFFRKTLDKPKGKC